MQVEKIMRTINEEVPMINEKLLRKANESDLLIQENATLINRASSKIINLQTIDFKNDFIKGDFINTVADIDWVVSDNSIIPKCNQTAQKGTLAIYKKHLVQDGEIGVTIKGYDLATTRDFWTGIIVKGLDINNNILVAINPFDNSVNIFKNSSGFLTSLRKITIDNPQSLLNSSSTNLVVKFYGTLFSVFINGTCYIKDYSSAILRDYKSNGYFGVGSYSSSIGGIPFIQNIEFKDIWIKEYKYDTMPNKINKILYTGDSNCIGQGVAIEERWSNLLDEKIKTISKNYTSKNVGSGGKTTLEIFENQIKTNINNSYDICTILGGTNNSRVDDVGTTLEGALNDISYSVRYIKAFGVIPIICLPSIIDRTINTMAYKVGSYNWLNEYRNGLIRIATIEKIPFVDFSNELNNDLTLLQSDKIHLNTLGHVKCFEMFEGVIFGTYKGL